MSLHLIARRLLDYEALIMAAAVAATLVSARLLPLAIGLGLAFLLLRWLVYRRLSLRTPVDWGTVGLLLMLPVTLWVTAYPDETRLQVLRLLSGMFLFYSLVNGLVGAGGTLQAVQMRRLRWAVWALGLVGVGMAAFALVSVRWNEYKLSFIPAGLYNWLPRLVSDTVHPNVMAGALVILIPLLLGWLLFAWGDRARGERMGLLLAVGFMLLVLLLTKSRGAWIGLAAALVVLVWLRWHWSALVLGLAAAWTVWAASLGWSTLLEVLTAYEALSGLEIRLEIWSRGLYMIRDFPFTGVGMGSYGPLADRLYPFFLQPPGSIPHAHNLFMQVAVDLGIPGLVAWLVVFTGAATCAWRVWRTGQRQGNPWMWALGAGLIASQVALLVHGLTDATTWGLRPAPLVWALWGLACAAAQIVVRPNEAA